MGKMRSRAGRTGGGSGVSQRARPDDRRRRAGRPRGVGLAVFHVRDLAPVNALMTRVHSTRGRKKRPSAGAGRGGRRARSARAGDHPPLYLTDDKHLIGVAGSLAGAKVLRDFIRETLGDAVEHVRTSFVKAPKAVDGGSSKVRRRR